MYKRHHHILEFSFPFTDTLLAEKFIERRRKIISIAHFFILEVNCQEYINILYHNSQNEGNILKE